MRGVSFAAALSLAILPAFVSAGMYREGGPVKNLQDKVFRKSLKSEVRVVLINHSNAISYDVLTWRLLLLRACAEDSCGGVRRAVVRGM